MKVKLSDIAAEANVSVMTVSNVLNGRRAKASPDTVKRVMEVADRLGYVPNFSARSLAAAKSHIIAALVPVEHDSSMFMSPHTAEAIGGMERHLRHEGYHVLLRGVERRSDISATIRGWSLDGAFLIEFPDETINRLDAETIPLVAIDSYSTNPRVSSVRSDDRGGGKLAAERLIAAGHEELLFAAPPFSGLGVVGQRWEGFRTACLDAGISEDRIRVAEALTRFEDGKALGHRLAGDFPEVTGIFATADTLALGIMAGADEAGLLVPHDISIIGFDDLEIAHYSSPGLTSISQNMPAKIEAASKLILDAIDGKQKGQVTVTLDVNLVDRQTVAAPSRSGR